MALIILHDIRKALNAMPKAHAARITEALEQVAADVTRRLPFVTEMAGQPGMWRLRKGQWRATYRIVNGDIEVASVGHRKEVYE